MVGRWEAMEFGLRPVGAIGAYAPEGMWNSECWKLRNKTKRFEVNSINTIILFNPINQSTQSTQ
jgi:hypothetical protein